MNNDNAEHELHLAAYIELEYTLRDGTIEYQYIPLLLRDPLDKFKIRKAEAITYEERAARINARMQAKTEGVKELTHLDD